MSWLNLFEIRLDPNISWHSSSIFNITVEREGGTGEVFIELYCNGLTQNTNMETIRTILLIFSLFPISSLTILIQFVESHRQPAQRVYCAWCLAPLLLQVSYDALYSTVSYRVFTGINFCQNCCDILTGRHWLTPSKWGDKRKVRTPTSK